MSKQWVDGKHDLPRHNLARPELLPGLLFVAAVFCGVWAVKLFGIAGCVVYAVAFTPVARVQAWRPHP